MKITDPFEYLASTGWLATLPPKSRAEVLARARPRRLASGEVLHQVDGPPGGLVGLAEGSLAVDVALSLKYVRKAFLVHPGAWVGEGTVSVLEARLTGIWATRDSTVLTVSRPAFREVAADDPDLWRHLMAVALENQLRGYRMAEALMERDSRIRLVRILLLLGGQFDAYAQHSPDLDIEQGELATVANLSRSTLNPLLRALERDGLIGLGRGRITLRDADRLKALVS